MNYRSILPLLTIGLISHASGALSLVNGDFSTNTTSGWTVTGTANASSGSAVISSGGQILQDFDSTGNQLTDFTASFNISFGAINNAHRIRFEGNAGLDMISLRLLDATTIQAFNGGTWANVVTGLSMTVGTSYTLSIVGQGFGTSLGTYTIGLSQGSTALGTSVSNVAYYHALVPATTTFETFTVGASTGGVTVDNFQVVPEPATAILGGLGLLGLLRRRRR